MGFAEGATPPAPPPPLRPCTETARELLEARAAHAVMDEALILDDFVGLSPEPELRLPAQRRAGEMEGPFIVPAPCRLSPAPRPCAITHNIPPGAEETIKRHRPEIEATIRQHELLLELRAGLADQHYNSTERVHE